MLQKTVDDVVAIAIELLNKNAVKTLILVMVFICSCMLSIIMSAVSSAHNNIMYDSHAFSRGHQRILYTRTRRGFSQARAALR